MLFEVGLSAKALVSLFGKRLYPLQEFCLEFPADGSIPTAMFDRIDLKGLPTFTPMTDPNAVTLADGSTVDGHRLLLRQRFDIFMASFNKDTYQLTHSPLTGYDPSATDDDAWLDLSIGIKVNNGNAQMCVEYKDLHVPEPVKALLGVAKIDIDDVEAEVKKRVGTTCAPILISDILQELEKTLDIGSLFTSTDVSDAGMWVWAEEAVSIIIRIELGTVDPDSVEAWTNFHKGIDVPRITDLGAQASAAAGSIDWLLTIDRRLFARVVASMAADLDAKGSGFELYTPTGKWHPSLDLTWWVPDPQTHQPVLTKVATALPTLRADIPGTAADVCENFWGLVKLDVGFTAQVQMAFTVPVLNKLRFYLAVGVLVDSGDELLCGLATFPTSLLGGLADVFEPVGAYLLSALKAMTGAVVPQGSTPMNLPETGTCHKEYEGYQLKVCDIPWPASTALGMFNLTHAVGIKRGLVLLGSLGVTPSSPATLKVNAGPFAWHPSCGKPIESKDDLGAFTKVWTNVRRCDMLLLDNTGVYKALADSDYELHVWCLKPMSQLPSYPCRLLIATYRGVWLVVIEPPPPDVSMGQMSLEQELLCTPKVYPNKEWVIPKDHPQIFVVEPDLVIVDITLAGLPAKHSVDLRADGKVIASGRPGADGFVTVSAELPAEARDAQLSVRTAGRGRWARGRRWGVVADLELWRRAGTVAVFGEYRDLAGPDDGNCWLATSHGLLHINVNADPPALIDHISMSGIRQLALTEYGLFIGGENGLQIIDPDTRAIQEHHETGPVRMLAHRGSTLLTGGNGTIRSLNLRWNRDARGRRRLLVIDEVGTYKTGEIESGLLAGQFLTVQLANRLDIYRLHLDGTLGSARSVPIRSVRGTHHVVGSTNREATVTRVGQRAVLLRVDALAQARIRRPETLELPEVPWFVGSRRTPRTLLRLRRDGLALDVFTLLRRANLLRPPADMTDVGGTT